MGSHINSGLDDSLGWCPECGHSGRSGDRSHLNLGEKPVSSGAAASQNAPPPPYSMSDSRKSCLLGSPLESLLSLGTTAAWVALGVTLGVLYHSRFPESCQPPSPGCFHSGGGVGNQLHSSAVSKITSPLQSVLRNVSTSFCSPDPSLPGRVPSAITTGSTALPEILSLHSLCSMQP